MGLDTVPVFEIEHRLQGQTAPKDATVAPADPGGVALALKGGEPPLALEARAAPLAEGMHLHGVKRPGRYLLDGEGVQMDIGKRTNNPTLRAFLFNLLKPVFWFARHAGQTKINKIHASKTQMLYSPG